MKYLIFLLVGLTFSACQNPEKPTENSANEPDAVARAVDMFAEAMLNPTKKKLLSITHPDLTYGHSSGTLEDRAAFMDVLLSGTNVYQTFEISEQSITVSEHTAWVRHIMDAAIDIPDESIEVHLNVLTTWVKRDGNWVLFARQAYKS